MQWLGLMVKACAHQYARGGNAAHILRRAIHLGSVILLWFYYQYGQIIARSMGLELSQLSLAVFGAGSGL